MAVSRATSIVTGRLNPGSNDDRGLATYSGSPLDVATTTESLTNKTNQIIALIKKRDDAATKNSLVNEDFQGFKDIAYQDVVLQTSIQTIQANEHYEK